LPRSTVATTIRRRILPRRGVRRADLSALLLFAFGAITCPVTHAADDAAQLFAAGRLAFENGDFPAALDAFDAAVRSGLSGPAVYFNIGVAAFRAGEYTRAEAAFTEVARTPAMAALAHYNLGLVSLRRNDQHAARRWFARAEQEAADDRLRTLAASQLSGLPAPPDRNWFGYASLGAGYDDNVALVSSAEVLGVSGVDDAFAEVQLAVGGPLAQPWRFDASLAYLDYADLDAFDQLGVQGGARYRVSLRDWTDDFFAQLAYLTLDGASFENRRMVGMQASRDLSREWRIRAQYRFSDVDGMGEFSGVTGQSHEAAVRLSRSGQPWDFEVEYRFETSDSDDRNFSATRHQLALDASRNLSENWLLWLDATLRNSRYDLPDNGNEHLVEVAVAVARTLSARWRLVLRYDFTHNDAHRADFNYERNRITAIVEAVL
jgi:tetratricopeptide (TPR) repeat protein